MYATDPLTQAPVGTEKATWLTQSHAHMAPGEGWLSPNEVERCRAFRFSKRREDWKLGRWTAKLNVARRLGLTEDVSSLSAIDISNDEDGKPHVLVAGDPSACALSISHRAGRAMCTVVDSGVRNGCDLELCEPHGETFAADYFNAEELALAHARPGADRDAAIALLWAAKESAVKAVGTGFRIPTGSITALPEDITVRGDWRPLNVAVDYADLHEALHGWWRIDSAWVMTWVSDRRSAPPAAALAY